MADLNHRGGGFSVVPAELHVGADNLRDTIAEFGGQAALKYRLNADEVGHEELARALHTFQETSHGSLDAARGRKRPRRPPRHHRRRGRGHRFRGRAGARRRARRGVTHGEEDR